MDENKRRNEVVKAGTHAAIVNVLLALLEALEGLFVGSFAVMLDGLSHITEAAGSVITVLGTKYAGKQADHKHPFGYGRIEYMSGLIVAGLVTYAGITALVESVDKILHPTEPAMHFYTLLVVVISLVARIFVGRHDIHTGHLYQSSALVHAGREELTHSLISLGTLISGAVYLLFHIQLAGIVGLVISIIIIYSGLMMLRDSVSRLLGEHLDKALIGEIKDIINSHEAVKGTYDVVINNYGPVAHTGSVHIAVLDTMKAEDIDVLTRWIVREVKQKTHVFLTGVSIYSINTCDKEVIDLRNDVQSIIDKEPHVHDMHGFYYDKEKHSIRFDAVIDFENNNPQETRNTIKNKILAMHPQLLVYITIDPDLA